MSIGNLKVNLTVDIEALRNSLDEAAEVVQKHKINAMLGAIHTELSKPDFEKLNALLAEQEELALHHRLASMRQLRLQIKEYADGAGLPWETIVERLGLTMKTVFGATPSK